MAAFKSFSTVWFKLKRLVNFKKEMEKIEVGILELSKAPNTEKNYQLIFGVINDETKKLTMHIGEYEAQTLAITLENMRPAAPLPLDLLQDAFSKFGQTIKEVVIDDIIDGVYKSKVVCLDKGAEVPLNARPSDAATLAAKFRCPIYVNKKLLPK